MLFALALAGCQGDEPPPDAPPPPDAAAVRAAAETAASDFAAGRYVASAEGYERALELAAAVPTDEHGEPWPTLHWRRQRVMAPWLGGELADATAAADAAAAARPRAADYFAALSSAMVHYERAGMPMDTPGRKLDVLSLAPALQLWQAAGVDAASLNRPPDGLPIETEWGHIERLPWLLSGISALDGGRARLDAATLVAMLIVTSADDAAAALMGAMTPAQRREAGLIYPLPGGGGMVIQLAPTPGDQAGVMGEWIGWLGANQSLWNAADPPRTWHLLLGVLADHRVADWWLLGGQWAGPRGQLQAVPGPADSPRVVFRRPAGERLLAGWNVALTETGAGVLVDTRMQAQLVMLHARRLGGPGSAPTAVAAGGKLRVNTPNRPGLAGLVAGWLAYHDWPVARPTTAPDEPMDLGPTAVPGP